jgi:CBS-domain-containing membrane protein
MKGNAHPAVSRFVVALYRALGAGVAIAGLEVLAAIVDEPLSRIPFITSIVLVIALPNSPAAQPRALIGGHVISCLAGWLSVTVFGAGDIARAVGVGAATLAMIATGTLHPPAGLDAFLVATQGLPLQWIGSPVLIGAMLLAAYARILAIGERLIVVTLE